MGSSRVALNRHLQGLALMKWFTVKALVSKDLVLFFRNSFFAFITVLGLVSYIAMYLLLPGSIDETIGLGLYAPDSADRLIQGLEEEGERVIIAASDAELRQAVLDGEVIAGIAFPGNLAETIGMGARLEVTVYLASDAPEEMSAMAEYRDQADLQ